MVDSSWHMPATGRSGREEYLQSHIPGARFLDIDAVADTTNPAPHMLPSAEEFGDAMREAGRRPRRSHRRLRQQSDAERRARLVHVPPFRAPSGSRSSTAASRSGWLRAARPKAGSPARVRRSFDAVERRRRGGQQAARSRTASALRWSMHAAGPGLKARRQTRARASPRAISPERATCLFRSSTIRTARSSRARKSGSCSSMPAWTRRSRSSPPAAQA